MPVSEPSGESPLGEKAWLFFGSDDHAQAAANLFSLIASCQLHGLDPETYLAEIFRVLPYWSRDRYLELAPSTGRPRGLGSSNANSRCPSGTSLSRRLWPRKRNRLRADSSVHARESAPSRPSRRERASCSGYTIALKKTSVLIGLDEIASERFVLTRKGRLSRRVVDAYFQKHDNFVPRIAVETNALATVLALVRSTPQLITILPVPAPFSARPARPSHGGASEARRISEHLPPLARRAFARTARGSRAAVRACSARLSSRQTSDAGLI